MRNATLLVLALASVGCEKKKADAPVTGAADKSSAGVAKPARAECPSADALEKLVAGKVTVAAIASVDVACHAGSFGEPGFYLVATVTMPEEAGDPIEEHTGIVSADLKRDLVPFTTAQISPGAAEMSGREYEVVDLDGDGTDELVETFAAGHGGVTFEGFTVWRVKAGALTRIEGHNINYDDSAGVEDDSTTCVGEKTIETAKKGKHIVVTVESANKPKSESCLPKGRHVFALDGDKLVEVR